MFAVMMISWMVLPWHMASIKSFTKDAAVASALTANAPAPGIYVLPKMDPAAKDAAPSKPFAFVAVGAQSMDKHGMNGAMFKALLLSLFSAGLLTKMLKKAAGSNCCPVGCSAAIGTLVAVTAYVPNMIWWQFPLNYSLIGMLDIIVGFTLAGAVISKCVLGDCKPKGECS